MDCDVEWYLYFVSILTSQGLLPHTSANSLDISPELLQTTNMVDSKVLCQARDDKRAPLPLAACQFFIFIPHNDYKSPIYDLTNGSSSILEDGYKYYGTGLQKGQCGIEMGQNYITYFGILSCRVRTSEGRWLYKKMDINNFGGSSIPYNLSPQEVVALSGANVSYSGTADRGITECSFYLLSYNYSIPVSFNAGPNSGRTSAYQYYGAGLNHAQCGITLFNVNNKDNGFIVTSVYQTGSYNRRTAATLIVATAPTGISLRPTYFPALNEGDILNATCTATKSRPVANITWLLGDRVVRQDMTNEEPPEAEWLWSHDLQTITQHLSLRVRREDNGNRLICRVGHVAWPSDTDQVVSEVIHVIWLLPHTSANTLDITPEYIQKDSIAGTRVLCQALDDKRAPLPLAACQFLIFHPSTNYTSPIYDLTNGSSSILHDGNKYYGTGLQRGQCGIEIGTHSVTHFGTLGCRVRTSEGRWMYKKTDINIRGGTDLPYNLAPHEQVALSGANVTYCGTADRELSSCWFYLPSHNYSRLITFNEGHNSERTSAYRYYGAGLNHAQCGITLFNVDSEDNGFIYVGVYQTGNYNSRTSVTLIVATAPTGISLRPTYFLALNEGDLLNATCTATKSRPIANITWLLGDRVVRQDMTNQEPPEAEWLWSYDLQTITQHLSLRVRREDNGNRLMCRVGHVAFPSGTDNDTSESINVKFQPAFDSHPRRQQVGIEGQSFALAVKATANPPEVTYAWTKDGASLAEHAGGPILHIARLSRKDSGVYACQANNSVGSASLQFELAVTASVMSLSHSLLIADFVLTALLVGIAIVVYLRVARRCCWAGAQATMVYDEVLYHRNEIG